MKHKKNEPGERKKPGPKPIEIDYDAVAFHSRSQISDAALARKLKISPQAFSARLQRDEKLREAREGGTWDGQSIVSDAMFRKMLDRYMTVCKECHKIRFSFEQFYETCPYCDKIYPLDPETGLDENGSDHTKVSHKFVQGDSNLMIFWSKNHLNMSDRVIHEGNENKPLVFSTLADFAKHQAAKNAQEKQAKSKAKGEKQKQASLEGTGP